MISRNSLADEDVTGAKPPPSYGTIRTERLAVVMKQVYFHRRQRRTSVHINFKQNPSSTEVVSSGEAQDLHSANEWKETSRANVPLLRPAPKKTTRTRKRNQSDFVRVSYVLVLLSFGNVADPGSEALNILLVCIPISARLSSNYACITDAE